MRKKVSVFMCIGLLAGCAGINSEFENSIPAKDSGYWLQQADDMTNPDVSYNSTPFSNVAFNRGIDTKQYKLINTGKIRLPVKTTNTIIRQPILSDNQSSKKIENTNLDQLSNHPINKSDCSSVYCYPEPDSPFRHLDDVSRVWIAPYVSPDDNVHLGEVVYFVVKKSSWAGIQ